MALASAPTIQSIPYYSTSHFSLASACFLRVLVVLPHHTMDNFDYIDPDQFDYTDPDFDEAYDALWSELMRSHSYDFALQSIHTANNYPQDSNTPHDTASAPVPTTLTGTFTQTDSTYPVSKQRVDRAH